KGYLSCPFNSLPNNKTPLLITNPVANAEAGEHALDAVAAGLGRGFTRETLPCWFPHRPHRLSPTLGSVCALLSHRARHYPVIASCSMPLSPQSFYTHTAPPSLWRICDLAGVQFICTCSSFYIALLTASNPRNSAGRVAIRGSFARRVPAIYAGGGAARGYGA